MSTMAYSLAYAVADIDSYEDDDEFGASYLWTTINITFNAEGVEAEKNMLCGGELIRFHIPTFHQILYSLSLQVCIENRVSIIS